MTLTDNCGRRSLLQQVKFPHKISLVSSSGVPRRKLRYHLNWGLLADSKNGSYPVPICALLSHGPIRDHLGVDDMFLMLGAWRMTDPRWSVQRRMAITMGDAGASITVTSLTNAGCFGRSLGCGNDAHAEGRSMSPCWPLDRWLYRGPCRDVLHVP